jgi:hypothetical protein
LTVPAVLPGDVGLAAFAALRDVLSARCGVFLIVFFAVFFVFFAALREVGAAFRVLRGVFRDVRDVAFADRRVVFRDALLLFEAFFAALAFDFFAMCQPLRPD